MRTSHFRPRLLRFGAFEVDLQAGCLAHRGVKIKLRHQMFAALALLLERAGEVVTREELRQKLWPGDVVVDFENALNSIIARLRKVLRDPAERPQYIETIPKRGYRFLVPVTAEAPAGECPESSIAVLPFTDLSPEKDQDYFCDGLAEELINSLGHIQSLKVAARTSAFSFKGKDIDIRRIGAELNVQVVLTGSVRKAGETLRITAELVGVGDGYQLWSERYDREAADIFSVQDEIALEIVGTLQVKLVKGEKTKVLKRPTRNKDAHDLYLKGRYFWNRRNEGDLKKAVECYDEAIRSDPGYSLPYLGIADLFIMMGLWNFLSPGAARLRAKEALDKALEIDDGMGEAYTSLGYYQCLFDWEWPAAEKNLKRGISLNPRNPWAHAWYGCYLLGRSRFQEARSEMRAALNREPLSPIINALAGVVFSLLDAGEGKRQMEKALEIEPNLALAHFWMGWILMYPAVVDEEAPRYLRTAVDLGHLWALGWLGCCYGRQGRRAEAFEVLRRLGDLADERYVSPLQKSAVFSGLGMFEQAFEMLEEAFRQKEPILALLLYGIEGHSAFPPEFRREQRFKALMRRTKSRSRYAT